MDELKELTRHGFDTLESQAERRARDLEERLTASVAATIQAAFHGFELEIHGLARKVDVLENEVNRLIQQVEHPNRGGVGLDARLQAMEHRLTDLGKDHEGLLADIKAGQARIVGLILAAVGSALAFLANQVWQLLVEKK